MPKTNNSIREVYMCDTVYNYLKEYKILQEKNKRSYKGRYKNYYLKPIKNKYNKIIEYKVVECKYKKDKNVEMVFTRNDGRYVGNDFIKYPLKIIHNELGIENCRFYDLRGSFATNCLKSGCQIKDVSKILGHSRIETTQNYCITSSEESKKEVIESIEELLKDN